MSLIYTLVTELTQIDDAPSEDSSSSSEDEVLNEQLGLASGLKAVKLGEMGIGGPGGIVKGGEVVAILWDRMQNMSGDPTAYKLYGTLLKAAGKPFAGLVERWIRTGLLRDPYEELMVKESKFINKGTLEMDYTDEYWERRYTVSTTFMTLLSVDDILEAPRWIKSFCAVEETPSWSATPSNSWRSTTRRCMYPTFSGELEA